MLSEVKIIPGHYRLKIAYWKNLCVGFGASAGAIILAAVLMAVIIGAAPPKEIIVLQNPPGPGTFTVLDTIYTPEVPNPQGGRLKPEVGIPVPVADSLIVEEPYIPRDIDWKKLVRNNPYEGLEGAIINIDVDKIIKDVLPSEGTFTPYDDPPVKVNNAAPKYPALALRAGIEATVWLNTLIDSFGKVREVKVMNPSESTAEFEKEAVEAAYRTSWKPAIANGQPVAVWVTYKIEFVLR